MHTVKSLKKEINNIYKIEHRNLKKGICNEIKYYNNIKSKICSVYSQNIDSTTLLKRYTKINFEVTYSKDLLVSCIFGIIGGASSSFVLTFANDWNIMHYISQICEFMSLPIPARVCLIPLWICLTIICPFFLVVAICCALYHVGYGSLYHNFRKDYKLYIYKYEKKVILNKLQNESNFNFYDLVD